MFGPVKSGGAGTALGVAREFFALAKAEASPNFTNMKLMKLLYRAQAASLHDRGKILFVEKVKAWKQGPVVPQVFHLNNKVFLIPFSHAELSKPSELPSDDRQLVHAIWTRYRSMTGDQMSDQTHLEDAWILTRATAGDDPSPEIPLESMRSDVAKDRESESAAFAAFLAQHKRNAG